MSELLLTWEVFVKYLKPFRVKICSAGAPERRDSKRTQLLTRQMSPSGLSGGDDAEELISLSKRAVTKRQQIPPEPDQRSRRRTGGLICRRLEEALTHSEDEETSMFTGPPIHPSIVHPSGWRSSLFSSSSSALNPLIRY